MKEWTWPAAMFASVVMLVIGAMFIFVDDPGLRRDLIDYLDLVVPFIVGTAAGGTVGGTVGYLRGTKA